MSKWRIFIVSLALLTLLIALMSGCDNTKEYSLTVTVDPPGGGTISPAVGTHDYDDGTEVDVIATATDGYVFDHWSVGGDLEETDNPVTIIMTADMSITAHFTPIYDLMVDIDPIGAGEVTLSEEGPYKEDTEVTLTAAPADGYVFNHWSVDGDLEETANPVTVTMDSDKAITAHFDPVYDLTVDVDPVDAGEVTLFEEGPYKEDTEVTLTAEPADGYIFDHWSGDASGNTNPVTITMASNKTVTAHFTPVMYSLIVDVFPDYGGTVQISPLQDSYAPGTEVTLTVSLNKTTYSLTYWRMEGIIIGYENSITIIMDSDKEITAVIYCGG